MANNLESNPLEGYLGERRFHENWSSFFILGIILILLGILAIVCANYVTLTSIISFGVTASNWRHPASSLCLLGKKGAGIHPHSSFRATVYDCGLGIHYASNSHGPCCHLITFGILFCDRVI